VIGGSVSGTGLALVWFAVIGGVIAAITIIGIRQDRRRARARRGKRVSSFQKFRYDRSLSRSSGLPEAPLRRSRGTGPGQGAYDHPPYLD
jgi:hypothetical protein